MYLAVHDSVCLPENLQVSVYAQFNYSAKRNNLIIENLLKIIIEMPGWCSWLSYLSQHYRFLFQNWDQTTMHEKFSTIKKIKIVIGTNF